MVDLDVKLVPQEYKVLGRQMVHDPRSRSFPAAPTIDRSKWRSKAIRIYDPPVNPMQCHGECTGTTKAMQFNSSGNRIPGQVLGMQIAHNIYQTATLNDPWSFTWPPTDSGSSGLASAIAAQKRGLGGEYRHVFGGADEVIQLIMEWQTVSCGSWWTSDMMTPNAKRIIEPTGRRVGGHQYLAHGYDLPNDMVIIRCWWGQYKDVFIKRDHLNDLLMNDGDAHVQKRKVS